MVRTGLAEKICFKLDPTYKYVRTEYNEILESILTSDFVWIDIGCGSNKHVKKFGKMVKYTVGMDLLPPSDPSSFFTADMNYLPLKSGNIDLITVRFVVEHIKNIEPILSEIQRILKPGGQLLILTTNTWSPYILLGRLLPLSLKTTLIRFFYRINESNTLPAWHRFNSIGKMKSQTGDQQIGRMITELKRSITSKKHTVFSGC